MKNLYVYTQLIENTKGMQEPSTIFPWVEGVLALFRNGGMCSDIDGERTHFADKFDQGEIHGYVSRIVEEVGWLPIVEVVCTDEGWAAFQQVFDDQNPLIYGDTPEGFLQAARERRNTLYRRLKQWRPALADRVDSLEDVEWLIENAPANDQVTTRFKEWMLARINGTNWKCLPDGLVDEAGTWIDYTNARAVWDRWRAEAEGQDYKILMRLWEFYCLNYILVNASDVT